MIRCWLIACAVVFALQTFGQATSGQISGFVYDPSGRPVRGARIAVADEARGQVRRSATDDWGYFRIAELPPAPYRVEAEANGFEPGIREGVPVAVGSMARVDFHLTVRGMKQEMSVSAKVSFIEVESSGLGMVLDQTRVNTLPLNRRDFLQLSLFTPGVWPAVEDSELADRGGVSIHAGGAREEANNFLLDGIDNNDQGPNRYVLQPPVDAIQEFKISTSTYSAEHGRSMGGQVNVITKGGGNLWSGFAYEYLRNRRLDARNYFDSGDRTKYIRNQFGAGVGGPLRAGRTFIFGSVDRLKERRGLSRLSLVPGVVERTGDLSMASKAVVDPFTRQPFPGGVIPKARINPLAASYLGMFPLPNRSAAGANLLSQTVADDNVTQASIRLDEALTDKDRLSFRYSHGRREMFSPFVEENSDVPGFGDFLTDTGHNAMFQHQRTLGARMVHSLRLGLNRANRQILQQNHELDVGKTWGVTYLPANPISLGYPAVTVAGYSRVGDPTQLPIRRPTTTYQISEDLSIAASRHFLKFGAEVRRNDLNGMLDLLSRGSQQFSGALSGVGLGDLLLGLPSLGIQSKPDNIQTLRTTAYALYVQDDWRPAPRLTLNLGLRYEFNTPYSDRYDRMSSFDPATGVLARVGTAGFSRSGYSPDYNNFAPRFGFAWNIADRTVLRGGYGVYFDAGMGMVSSSLYFNPPFFTIRVFFPTANSLLTLQNPYPSTGGYAPPASLSAISPDMRSSYLQSWSFNVQREFGGLGIVSVAYSGSKGTGLIRSRDLNQPPPGAGTLQFRRQYTSFANIFWAESGGNSNLHSLQASFDRRLAKGLSLIGVYAWGHSIDDTSAFLGNKQDPNFPQDSSNFRLERASSSFDIRQRVMAAATYHPPASHWLWKGVDLSVIASYQTPQPFTPILRFETSNTGNSGGNFGSDRPMVLRSPQLSDPSPERWFDTGAFALPGAYRFGNAGRNIVRGPSNSAVHLSVSRRIPVTDRISFNLQAQAFNILNQTNFDQPKHYADEPESFGRIYSAKAPRQFQLVLRFVF